MIKRISVLVAWTTALLVGCGGHEDVTKDPAYGFAAMAGTSWKLKIPIALQDNGTCGHVCTEKYAADFMAGTADRGKFGTQDPAIDILPSGTTIRLDILETGSVEMGGCYVFFSVPTGKYIGKLIMAPNELFLPNYFITPDKSTSTTWAINPDNLEKP